MSVTLISPHVKALCSSPCVAVSVTLNFSSACVNAVFVTLCRCIHHAQLYSSPCVNAVFANAASIAVSATTSLFICCVFPHRPTDPPLLHPYSTPTPPLQDSSANSSRGGLSSPFSVSNETMEKERYVSRYASGRNSGRRSQSSRAPDYEERPPPYTEKPRDRRHHHDDSLSDEGLYEDQEGAPPPPPPPTSSSSRGSRRRSRNREPDDSLEAEEDTPRTRRGRSRSQDERTPSRVDEPAARLAEEPRRPGRDSRRDERESSPPPPPRDDRYRSVWAWGFFGGG